MARAATASYHHGDLRKALVDEAARLVEGEGVDALTLRELARRLDVSHAAPAHHFADKTALLAELAAVGFEELAVALEEGARSGRTPAAQLREAGRAYLHFALRRPGHYRVMFGRELRAVPPTSRLATAGDRAFAALQRAVTAALPAPRSRSADRVKQAAFFAWSSTHGAAMLLLDGPPVLEGPARDRAAMIESLVDGLTASVAAAIARGG
jgi:AcrR family transcriptional regulator